MKKILTSTILPIVCTMVFPSLPYGDDAQGTELNQINPPKIDEETGEPTQKAISNAKQAHSIAKGLRDRAKEGRFTTAAVIASKYNGDAPFDAKKLRDLKQGWRNNFSTQFLPSIIDRVRPQFKKPIENAERITYSSLPAYIPEASVKSRKFCTGITKLIRSRPGWDDFVNQLTQEEILFGSGVPAWLDDSWMPIYFGYNETYLPEGSQQHASKLQLAVFGQQMLIHEFLEKIRDKEAAVDAGYNLKECYKAANESAGDAQKDDTPLDRVDTVREQGVLNYSYANQNKTVDLFHIVWREYNGDISMRTVSQKTGHDIRYVEQLHEESDAGFEDVCTLFTLQTGNRKFYGSKGLGRMLANLSIALERGRCLAADMSHLSGLLVMQADPKDINAIQPRVVHPFVVIPKGVDISSEKIEFSAQNYEILDQKLVNLAESIAGAFIPPNLDNQGASSTTIEAAQKAEREMAVRQGVLGRFFKQFADLVSAMQRKICSPTNIKEAQRIFAENQERQAGGVRIFLTRVGKLLQRVLGKKEAPKMAAQSETLIADKDAVNFLVDMFTEGLTVEEIAQLALAPSGNSEQANMEQQDVNTITFLQTQALNPYIDQMESTRMQAEIQLGADRAERVVLKDTTDPNESAAQIRLQLMELGQMLGGQAMPVAQQDDHRTHRKTIVGKATPLFELIEMAPTPEIVQSGELILGHYAEHLAKDINTTDADKAKEQEGLAGWVKLVEEAKMKLEQMAEQMADGTSPAEVPVPTPNGAQPLQTDANGNIMGENPEMQQVDIATKVGETALRAREVKIKEDDAAHRRGLDEVKTMASVAKTVADAAAKMTQAEQKKGLPGSQPPV